MRSVGIISFALALAACGGEDRLVDSRPDYALHIVADVPGLEIEVRRGVDRAVCARRECDLETPWLSLAGPVTASVFATTPAPALVDDLTFDLPALDEAATLFVRWTDPTHGLPTYHWVLESDREPPVLLEQISPARYRVTSLADYALGGDALTGAFDGQLESWRDGSWMSAQAMMRWGGPHLTPAGRFSWRDLRHPRRLAPGRAFSVGPRGLRVTDEPGLYRYVSRFSVRDPVADRVTLETQYVLIDEFWIE